MEKSELKKYLEETLALLQAEEINNGTTVHAGESSRGMAYKIGATKARLEILLEKI